MFAQGITVFALGVQVGVKEQRVFGSNELDPNTLR